MILILVAHMMFILIVIAKEYAGIQKVVETFVPILVAAVHLVEKFVQKQERVEMFAIPAQEQKMILVGTDDQLMDKCVIINIQNGQI